MTMTKRVTDEEALARFEDLDPTTATMHDRSDVATIAAAVAARDSAEEQLLDAVRDARARHVPWVLIASALRVTHQAARQKYKPLTEQVPGASR